MSKSTFRVIVSALGLGIVFASGCAADTDPRATGPAGSGLAALTAAASGDAGTPEALAPAAGETPSGAESGSGGAVADIAGTRSAVEATEGIPDVSELLGAGPPLATIAPSGSGPRGSLLYVRNGRFYTSKADGSQIRALDEDLPSVWSPPDDPGQAFSSPDGARVVFFGGRDAELWSMESDGADAQALTGPNIPTGAHDILVGEARGNVRLQPGHDYTLAVMAAGDDAVSLFVDDNSRHIKGEGRLRVIHVAPAARDKTLTVFANGLEAPRPIAYGRDTGDVALPFGTINLEVKDENGERVVLLPGITLGERELKTVFLYGADTVQASEATYQPSEPTSGASRVRVFNATEATVTTRFDEGLVLAADVAAGGISAYTAVNAAAGNDELADIERSMYGLDSGVAPVAWSPDGRHVAFVAAPDGQLDLYLATIGAGTQRLSNDPDTELAPSWSPNSRKLGWTALDAGFDVHRLFRFDLDDSRAAEIEIGAVGQAAGLLPDAGIVIPEGIGWVDDTRLYFYPVADGTSQGIWVADTTAGGVAPVYAQAIEAPVWSDRARQWAASVSDRTAIVAVAPDGSTTSLASGAANAPMWSPDGRSLSWVEGEAASPDGWVIHVVQADGSGDRVLTERMPLLQAAPPVPGPKAKRLWIDGGRLLAFSRAGRDYGAAERGGGFAGKAGEDIENLWVVPVDGSEEPERSTDITKSFYMKEIIESPEGEALALVAFSYLDRTQKLWAVASDGGKPVEVDSGVRWYMWLR